MIDLFGCNCMCIRVGWVGGANRSCCVISSCEDRVQGFDALVFDDLYVHFNFRYKYQE